MCGIFGYTEFNIQELDTARNALNSLIHRGPDQWNDFHNEEVFMGHRRLSILDLSELGRQPMISQDGNTVITVNGEIYNFQPLRAELINKGYSFESQSDSEVVLHGYAEWGITGLLDRIDGMYAIVIYDKARSKIYLVRDRAGIKPIYYKINGKRLYWASELKAITAALGKEHLKYDYTAIYDFYTYSYIPAPKTLYQGINKLVPATFLEFDLKNGDYLLNKYWELSTITESISSEIAADKLMEAMTNSIKEQMVCDVPVGFFLSGGLDSSTVVALAAEQNQTVKTFTIGFKDDPETETPYARMVADELGLVHREKILNQEDVNTSFSSIYSWYDEPFGDISCFPSFLVSRIAKEEVTVVLTGDGGDELFGGYKWYKAFKVWERYKLPYLSLIRPIFTLMREKEGIIGKIAKRLELLFLNEWEVYTRLMGGQIKSEKKALRKRWNISEEYDDYWLFRKFYRPELPTYTRLQYLDFHSYLPDDILTKVDRVSMAVSLECRVPFLSREIIELAFSIPEEIRNPNGQLKGLLKTTMTGLLPESIINRSKRGFNVPASTWKKHIRGKYANRHERIVSEIFKIK